MSGSAVPITGRRQFPWLRKHGLTVRLGACFLLITFVTVVVESAENWKPENNPVWVVNGILLAYLLWLRVGAGLPTCSPVSLLFPFAACSFTSGGMSYCSITC